MQRVQCAILRPFRLSSVYNMQQTNKQIQGDSFWNSIRQQQQQVNEPICQGAAAAVRFLSGTAALRTKVVSSLTLLE